MAIDRPLPAPRRSLLRVSVRGHIAVVLIAGAWAGWLAHSARTQRNAVASIRKAGGHVTYDCESDRSNSTSPFKIPYTTWLVRHIGIDFFGNVIEVVLYGPESDAELKQLGALGQLETLEVYDATITGSGLSNLRGLSRLRSLGLDDIADEPKWENLRGLTSLDKLFLGGRRTPDHALRGIGALRHLTTLSPGPSTTDGGLVHLAELTTLEVLVLDSSMITDAGLVHLAGLTGLRELYLNNTAITDRGLKHLKQLEHLKLLYLEGTPITGGALDDLWKLARLEELCLNDTDFADPGLTQLRGLTALRTLYLDGTIITDEGLLGLRALVNLCALHIRRTAVTDAGVTQLQSKLPNLTIIR